jgi:pimeloyl-ACP methyl ester carboxylesterase
MATATITVPTTRYLVRPEGRIAYDYMGSGPLVIAVPSLGDVRQEYRFLVPQLVEAGYRVVTMDLRGMGESSVAWSDYSAAAVGTDMLALIEELDAGPAILIGTSMAAGAGAWAAAERPELVAGIVLIGPFVRDVPAPAIQKLVTKAVLQRPWGPAFWRIYYRKLYPTAAPEDMSGYLDRLINNLREPGRFAVLQAMVAASKADVEQRLGEVRAPALVIMGTKDPDFKDPAAEARLVAERVRGELAMIDGAGHYPHAETPQTTGARIVGFLTSLQQGEQAQAAAAQEHEAAHAG